MIIIRKNNGVYCKINKDLSYYMRKFVNSAEIIFIRDDVAIMYNSIPLETDEYNGTINDRDIYGEIIILKYDNNSLRPMKEEELEHTYKVIEGVIS